MSDRFMPPGRQENRHAVRHAEIDLQFPAVLEDMDMRRSMVVLVDHDGKARRTKNRHHGDRITERLGFRKGRARLAAALRVRQKVTAAIDLLARPAIGGPSRTPGYFEKLVVATRYTACYGLDDDTLLILRIVHQSRNWPDEGWPAEE